MPCDASKLPPRRGLCHLAIHIAESFIGKFRDECLSMQSFENRIDATILIEDFRRGHNEVRFHSSLGLITPMEFK